MNERIEKLAIECYQAPEFDYKKFAELIVEECMWKIMTRKEEAIDNDWRVDEAMSAAISDISEHFGVEQ
jgi:hypothetical protein